MEKIAIIGLGYVGLPLAIEFARKYPVVGFDTNRNRIADLIQHKDKTLEVDSRDLRAVCTPGKDCGLHLSFESDDLKSCTIYIITVPTPITCDKQPDMSFLVQASEMVGHVLHPGNIVIYESTVYPGATEEICVPALEKTSTLRYNEDFFVGYSPERINPGDKTNTLTTIRKVVSGSTPAIADKIDHLYNSILKNGTFKVSSIKVAEASKVIENCQRDLNISFVNELALIFDRMGIDTGEVIDAASTKWNFIRLKPGLVGGHCISVDPYYLKWKAEQLGYIPEVIASGRRVNDSMAKFIADKTIKMLILRDFRIKHAQILILGVTFKENCPDIRNTKIVDVINELQEYQCDITCFDPWANKEEVKQKLGIDIVTDPAHLKRYDAIIAAVAHAQFGQLELDRLTTNANAVIFDLKGIIDKHKTTARL